MYVFLQDRLLRLIIFWLNLKLIHYLSIYSMIVHSYFGLFDTIWRMILSYYDLVHLGSILPFSVMNHSLIGKVSYGMLW